MSLWNLEISSVLPSLFFHFPSISGSDLDGFPTVCSVFPLFSISLFVPVVLEFWPGCFSVFPWFSHFSKIFQFFRSCPQISSSVSNSFSHQFSRFFPYLFHLFPQFSHLFPSFLTFFLSFPIFFPVFSPFSTVFPSFSQFSHLFPQFSHLFPPFSQHFLRTCRLWTGQCTGCSTSASAAPTAPPSGAATALLRRARRRAPGKGTNAGMHRWWERLAMDQ